MSAADLFRFVALAAIWGGSFIFMRVAAPEFGAAALMLVRCAIGAALLVIVLFARQRGGSLRAIWRPMIVLGLVNSALPFVLFGFAAMTLKTGVISVLNATAPFWGAMIAFVWLRERLSRWQVVGLVAGFAGVMVLVTGGRGLDGFDDDGSLLAVFVCLIATLSYGLSASFTRRFLGNADPLANATGSQISASLWLLVPGIALWPDHSPAPQAWISAIALGVLCTGIAYLLFFRLIANLGASRAMTVTFAVPLFGILWGALILDEAVTLAMVAGGAIVVLGCALTTGLIRPASAATGGARPGR